MALKLVVTTLAFVTLLINLWRFATQEKRYCKKRLVCNVRRGQVYPVANNYMSEFHEVFSTCYLWPLLGSVLSIVMSCTSGFVDDAMFSHNGASGPESGDPYISSSSPVGRQTTLCLDDFDRWQHLSRVAFYDCRFVYTKSLWIFINVLLTYLLTDRYSLLWSFA